MVHDHSKKITQVLLPAISSWPEMTPTCHAVLSIVGCAFGVAYMDAWRLRPTSASNMVPEPVTNTAKDASS